MPRKQDSILDVLVKLPWWFNLILAVITYFGLTFYLPTVQFKSQLFRGVSQGIVANANIFAGFFVFIALVSAFIKWRRGELLNSQTSIKSIKDLSWKDFELLLAEAYRRKDYAVDENVSAGADGGVDIRLRKDGKKTLVQCKNWRAKSVGVTVVRELYGIVTAEGADSGIVVCSGYYTAEANKFAASTSIHLVDADELVSLISSVQKQPMFKHTVAATNTTDTSCPKCNSKMVYRTAKKGKHAGTGFWGCSRFPKCRGTRA